MKKFLDWQVTLGLILVTLGALAYYLHYLIFRDAHHILIYFIGDFAFVFFEVLLVTLVIHRLLHHREMRATREKRNMLTGAFFSEVGTKLLGELSVFDKESEDLVRKLSAPDDWSENEFLGLREALGERGLPVSPTTEIKRVRDFLLPKKAFLIGLLQNPSLEENESFTDLVWSVFHLAGELEHTAEADATDRETGERLREDMRKVLRLLIIQWLEHMNRLKKDYPHLFLLSDRGNPFRFDYANDQKPFPPAP